MNSMKILVFLLWIALVNPGQSFAVQNCQSSSILASTPTERITDNQDGTVTDTATGLMWKRCAEGQVWDGTTCDGSIVTMTWREALHAAEDMTFAGHSDWRLPNIKELGSIVERQCTEPAINVEVFPGTPVGNIWSSSPSPGRGIDAWYVNFHSGHHWYYLSTDETTTVYSYGIRLVRGGE